MVFLVFFAQVLKKPVDFTPSGEVKKEKRLEAIMLPLQKTEEFSQADLKRRTVNFWTFGHQILVI